MFMFPYFVRIACLYFLVLVLGACSPARTEREKERIAQRESTTAKLTELKQVEGIYEGSIYYEGEDEIYPFKLTIQVSQTTITSPSGTEVTTVPTLSANATTYSNDANENPYAADFGRGDFDAATKLLTLIRESESDFSSSKITLKGVLSESVEGRLIEGTWESTLRVGIVGRFRVAQGFTPAHFSVRSPYYAVFKDISGKICRVSLGARDGSGRWLDFIHENQDLLSASRNANLLAWINRRDLRLYLYQPETKGVSSLAFPSNLEPSALSISDEGNFVALLDQRNNSLMVWNLLSENQVTLAPLQTADRFKEIQFSGDTLWSLLQRGNLFLVAKAKLFSDESHSPQCEIVTSYNKYVHGLKPNPSGDLFSICHHDSRGMEQIIGESYAGNEERRFLRWRSPFLWSPDGKGGIEIVSENGQYVMQAYDERSQTLTQPSTLTLTRPSTLTLPSFWTNLDQADAYFSPILTPEGDQLIFAKGSGIQSSIFVMNRLTRELRRLTNPITSFAYSPLIVRREP